MCDGLLQTIAIAVGKGSRVTVIWPVQSDNGFVLVKSDNDLVVAKSDNGFVVVKSKNRFLHVNALKSPLRGP
ncbi:hypothetical protein WH50_12205 [Pokkaliibacter plantistimulans]|uniref:Uncharacterized protein n=1 Tax=Pokkaliibacter plantistimulans TaxID=1635171 RepID=A0ABX5M0A9_9GAMM|nr:hypothetical protein WH50_12205 [Pokkaliibacter plantistimulans]